ncbi:GGDEF domain-containing protein [Paraglaciecola aquimarina]|uniref:diguanylate cyclase n=1 Tax=Paraglaciecola aquimarina TaxID=1235557 RepID=A0ABU3SZF5_9ALTE|nr:GGDEF domain-containing protein [Paraglaciecola aquimarina]MDU0355399.1 GGDEF domain-containing protein [Paraglaciecola aquimarina]
MNFSLLANHQRLFTVVCASFTLSLTVSLGLGQFKPLADVSWLDILGEGSVALLSLCWLVFILVSRPAGNVTTSLILGLSCFLFSANLDLMDEFVFYQESLTWLSMIESIPAGIGMLIMSYALYQWHQEQLILNKLLQKREAIFREHHQVDFITTLYDADYMRYQIDNKLLANTRPDFSVVMLDINNFDAFNRRFGHDQGDQVLREISDLILMNLRSTDLACRYAGDRFILLFPDTDITVAQKIAKQVKKAIANIAFKPESTSEPVYHDLTFAAESAVFGDGADNLLQRVSRRLDLFKQGQQYHD